MNHKLDVKYLEHSKNIAIMPQVSIITPCYNSADFIAETIEAIQAQTFTDWELLITDDCSKDNTVSIAEEYAKNDSRIKIFVLEQNGGGGVARNNSIKQAQGRYIAFCDSDDRWYPNKLEKQIEFMRKRDCALSYSSYMTCDESGEMNGIIVAPKTITFESLLKDCKIGCLTAIYDSEKVGKVYLPLIRKRQDWGLWIKVLKICRKAEGLKEPLAIYRLREGSISNNKLDLIKYNIGVYQEVLGWSKVRATIFFLFTFLPNYIAKKVIVSQYNK